MRRSGSKDGLTDIHKKYEEKCKSPSDIYKLLPALKRYSQDCRHITEMGIRGVTSTWALLAGSPQRLISYDIIYHPNIEEVKIAAGKAGIEFEFREEDVLDAVIEETDLLFLDTYHHYYQLLQELRIHSGRVKKYIIIHDTTTYAIKNEKLADECIKVLQRMGKDLNKYDMADKKGLMRAIRDFLREDKQWKIKRRFLKNNGMTVLSRA